jgi:hypothetical protein
MDQGAELGVLVREAEPVLIEVDSGVLPRDRIVQEVDVVLLEPADVNAAQLGHGHVHKLLLGEGQQFGVEGAQAQEGRLAAHHPQKQMLPLVHDHFLRKHLLANLTEILLDVVYLAIPTRLRTGFGFHPLLETPHVHESSRTFAETGSYQRVLLLVLPAQAKSAGAILRL